MERKRCAKCGRNLPFSAFRIRSRPIKKLSTALQSYCKKCNGKKSREYEKKDPFHKLASNIGRHGKHIPIGELRKIGEPKLCYLCNSPINWNNAELDHIIPLSRGGLNEIINLKWACRLCNRMKHDMLLDELIKRMHRILAHQPHQAG